VLKLKSNIKSISILFCICIVLLITAQYLTAIVAGLVSMLFLFILKKEYVPGLVAIMLLVLSSTFNEDLRLIIDLVSFALLIRQYIASFGLSISELKNIPKSITILCILIVLSLTVSSMFSDSFMIGVKEIIRQFIFLVLILFFYFSLNEYKDVHYINIAIVVSGVIMSVSLLHSFLTSSAEIYLLKTSGVVHESGYLGNVSGIGGVFAVTIPLTLYYIIISRNKEKLLFEVAMVLQSLGLFLTNSRGAIIAVISAIFLILLVLRSQLLKKIVTGLICLLVMTFLYFPSVLDLFTIYFRTDRILENARYFLWDISLSIIKNHPIFGVGPGMFKYNMYSNMSVMIGSWDEEEIRWVYENAGTGHSHNFYLYRLSELGVVGLLTGLLFPLLFFFISYKLIKKYKENFKIYSLTITSISIMIGLLFRGMVESTGILSNGWIARDICTWLVFSNIAAIYYKKLIAEV